MASTVQDSSEMYEDDLIDDGAEESFVPEEDEEVEEVESNSNKKGRGVDLEWQFFLQYDTLEMYNSSAIPKELKEKYSLRKTSETLGSTKEVYYCKFARKKKYVECKSKYRATFSNSTDLVYIEINGTNHIHEEKEQDMEGEGRKNYQWSTGQSKIVMTGVENGLSPTIIMRNLQTSGLPMRGLTKQQLYYKVNACNRLLIVTQSILDTGSLREAIGKMADVPVDMRDAYVAFSQVIDDKDGEEPRFCVIWTSKQLQARVDERLTQDDATYR